MEAFLLLLGIISLIVQGVFIWFFIRNERAVSSLHARIDRIFTVDLPTPNEATKKEEVIAELNEQNILNIPADVKIELEGKDEQIPPGYAVA